MDYLLLVNTLVAGFIFSIWSKTGWHNFAIKMLFMGLFLVNVLRLAGKA